MSKNRPVDIFFDKTGVVHRAFSQAAATSLLNCRFGAVQWMADGFVEGEKQHVVVKDGQILATVRRAKK